MEYLASLNPAQRAAVTTLSGPLLILAGAGTGKTRVITCRMAELTRRGVPADRILSVTFTNKAAREMLERTRQLLGSKLRAKPWISTFHSLCVRILREEAPAIGYPKHFTILDRGDQESIARGVLRDIRVSEKSMKPGDLLGVISRWKSAGNEADDDLDAGGTDLEFLAGIGYRKYQDRLRASGAMDFDDLLLLTDRLFRTTPQALARWQSRFQRVQIDEYQDTNGIQFRVAEALVREHRQLCVVGDDDQSIYAWRGADVTHILGFQRHFPESKVVRLEDNYRCTDRILQLANTLVQRNRDRHDKVLRAHKRSTDAVRVIEYPDEQIEAEKVVQEIKFLVSQKQVPVGDFAILFRTNEQPRLFEMELRKRELRYVLTGSQSFFDRKEVRDALSYLKVIANPDDESAMLRIINTPARGISDKTRSLVLDHAVKNGVSFWKMSQKLVREGKVSGKAGEALQGFHHFVDRWSRKFRDTPREMPALFSRLIEEIGYQREIERQSDDPLQQEMRANSLEELKNTISEFTERESAPTLDNFLSDVSLMGPDDEKDEEEERSSNAVRLMTLHSAKGLEFPRVYLVGMEEGLLPHKRSVDSEADTGDRKHIEEERRLCYVGITRARDHLTLTRAKARRKWGKVRLSVPSRFLKEMQDQADADDLTASIA